MEKRYNTDLGRVQTHEDFWDIITQKLPGYSLLKKDSWLKYPIITEDMDISKLKYIYPEMPNYQVLMCDMNMEHQIKMMWGNKK